MEEKRIIEVNGVKLEVDLRYAKQVDTYKVGDPVRVLVKKYSDNFYSYPGMIVGFDNFKERPTIIVAYLDTSAYSSDPLKFVHINKDTKEEEIAPMVDDFIALEKSAILENLDRLILKKEEETREMKAKKEYFLKYFGAYFKE
ncbi:MAG: hypothetical protein ACE14T_11935 [Syntrophales bacterium]